MPQNWRWSPPLTIAAMFALAALAAGGSAWFRMRSSQRAVAFLGHEAAQLVLTAPRVIAQPPAADAPPIDVSTAPGFLHLRRSLLSDRSYIWDAPPAAPQSSAAWTLKFIDGKKEATIRLDLQNEFLQIEAAPESVSITPAVAAFRKFFDDVAGPE